MICIRIALPEKHIAQGMLVLFEEKQRDVEDKQPSDTYRGAAPESSSGQQRMVINKKTKQNRETQTGVS